MTWSYNVADLATSEKDQIRLEIGDTDVNNQRLQDEEIAQAIAVERNFWCAAARCCEMIASAYLMKADVRLGRAMFVTYTKMADQFSTRACKLRQKSLGTQVPYGGGVLVADKNTIAGDSSLVAPAFTRTIQENPWTGGYTSDSLGPTPSETGEDGQRF